MKVEETRRMSDLLCVPLRPGWQVGISERRNLRRPGGVSPCGAAGRIPLLALRAWMAEERHKIMFFVNKAPRASADPRLPFKEDCVAGSHAKHQQSEIAKKKQQDAVFFVKHPPRASADPRLPSSLLRRT